MSKFNKNVRAKVESPLGTTSEMGRTYEGATAFAKDSKTQLFLIAVGSFYGEDSFYESASFRENSIRELSYRVAVEDVEWLTQFVSWLRREGNIRSASIAIALDGLKARLDAGIHGDNRRLAKAALFRGDEPGEAVAYWVSTYGKSLPKPLKRAVADFFRQHKFNSYGFQKYGRSGAFTHKDLIRLTHPKPAVHKNPLIDPEEESAANDEKQRLFKYILEKEDAVAPADIQRRKELLQLPVSERKHVTAEELKAAGFTWEQYAGWLQGEIDWNKIIPSMGYMALLRNLRNFEEAEIKSEYVRDKLRDPDEVKRSRQLPFRFISAYKELRSFHYTDAVETALQYSMLNIPQIPGKTIVLVDQSGSMGLSVSKKSKLLFREAAALFGSALAQRSEKANLWQYGTNAELITDFGYPLLRLVHEKFHGMGGTRTGYAVEEALSAMTNPDRIIIITDEQAHYGYDIPSGINCPVYIWNLNGYKMGHSGSNIFHLGGLSDNSFKIVQLLEAGKNAKWPWENLD